MPQIDPSENKHYTWKESETAAVAAGYYELTDNVACTDPMCKVCETITVMNSKKSKRGSVCLECKHDNPDIEVKNVRGVCVLSTDIIACVGDSLAKGCKMCYKYRGFLTDETDG